MKNPFTEKARFGLLSKLAKSCTVIPSSNADPERIFSILKKNQTDMRSELNIWDEVPTKVEIAIFCISLMA